MSRQASRHSVAFLLEKALMSTSDFLRFPSICLRTGNGDCPYGHARNHNRGNGNVTRRRCLFALLSSPKPPVSLTLIRSTFPVNPDSDGERIKTQWGDFFFKRGGREDAVEEWEMWNEMGCGDFWPLLEDSMQWLFPWSLIISVAMQRGWSPCCFLVHLSRQTVGVALASGLTKQTCGQ